MKPLVLSSSGLSTAESPRPRQDFVLLAEALDAELSLPMPPGQIGARLGLDFPQVREALGRGAFSAHVALSERVGVPLALRRPTGRLVLVAHQLTSSKKAGMQRLTRWLNRFDAIVVLCERQRRYLLEGANIPESRVHLVHDSIDTAFFAPEPAVSVEPGLVLAVGRERRDYATLGLAMKKLPDARAVVVADSLWARRSASGEDGFSDDSLTFRRGLPFSEMRTLYARASVVAVPLQPGIDYAAGVNGLLEALSMGKPTVVTRTPGIEDYLEGVAEAVAPSDPDALAVAIERALSTPSDPTKIRAVVAERASLEAYVSALKVLVSP
jgi:glycosyltransferase involved in cell wall biosynthesis